TGNLTYTPAADASGSATVTVSISDDGGTANGGDDTSDDQTFTITVNSVNDEPSFTAGANETVNENAGAQTVNGWATALDDGDTDAVQTLSFNVSNDNNSLFSAQPAIDATGNLTYTPAANANGSATVTVSISDDGGTANGGDDTSDDQTFTITIIAPTPTIAIGAPSATGTSTGPITYTITYTDADAVTLTTSDISLNTTGDATGSITVTGSGTDTRIVTISSITGDGTIGISIAAGTASNTAGNTSLAAGPSATFNVDNTGPTGFTVSIDQTVINLTNETGIDFTFGSAEVGATYNYLFESNGGGTNVTGSGIIATATDQITGINLSGLNDGLITLIVTLTDALGNTESVSAVDVRTKDTLQPTVTITSSESPGPTDASPIPVTITFSESVTGFEIGDLIISNGTAGNFAGSDNIYTTDITPSGAGPLTITVDVNADVVLDSAGNGNTAATQFSINFDSTLGVQDEILANRLAIYPIPSSNIINISGEISLAIKRADIFDIQGKLVLSQKLNASSIINTIDISSIRSGFYLMTIHSETGSATKRIIKQ
uniref:beta strand repeat-containing protein n=1 Tax=uncultured Aquimarina sp. TaxID=575652 RepID=UPI0026035318